MDILFSRDRKMDDKRPLSGTTLYGEIIRCPMTPTSRKHTQVHTADKNGNTVDIANLLCCSHTGLSFIEYVLTLNA